MKTMNNNTTRNLVLYSLFICPASVCHTYHLSSLSSPSTLLLDLLIQKQWVKMTIDPLCHTSLTAWMKDLDELLNPTVLFSAFLSKFWNRFFNISSQLLCFLFRSRIATVRNWLMPVSLQAFNRTVVNQAWTWWTCSEQKTEKEERKASLSCHTLAFAHAASKLQKAAYWSIATDSLLKMN